MKLLIVFGFLVVSLNLCFAKRCRFSPDVWCSSQAIAEQCGVYRQCKENVWLEDSNAKPVGIELYIESLCPDCKNFITDQLSPAFRNVLPIMNLTIIPYGNAMEVQKGGKWEFKCQHGPAECVGNLIETCAVTLLKNVSTFFPFIECIESSKLNPGSSAPACAKKFAIDYSPIDKCAKGDLGNHLEHEMAMLTNKLNPPHKYVPWIVVNGVHTEKLQQKAQTDLIQLICDTYQGTKPSACKKYNLNKDRCYKD